MEIHRRLGREARSTPYSISATAVPKIEIDTPIELIGIAESVSRQYNLCCQLHQVKNVFKQAVARLDNRSSPAVTGNAVWGSSLLAEGTNTTSSDLERRRRRLLRRFENLDSETEAAFDNLITLAAEVCEAPIAIISLVDENRQWFKSKVGLATGETSRSIAFCSYAIGSANLMTVTDASTDPRFKDNPLVTLDPKIRFYAGAALKVETGMNLGTLCVIDRVPRDLSQQQISILKLIRDQVVCQLNLRRLTGTHRKLNGAIPGE